MANAHLQLVAPSPVFGTVATPRRKPNAELRPREYLTEAEVERLCKAACTGNRNGHRDETMILIAFRHGLRASELVNLRWDAIDLEQGKVHCSRRKNGASSVHPLTDVELRALRRLKHEAPQSRYVTRADGVLDRGRRRLFSFWRFARRRRRATGSIAAGTWRRRHSAGSALTILAVVTRAREARADSSEL